MLALAILFVSAASALPVHHPEPVLPSGWSTAPGLPFADDEGLTFTVSLKQQGQDYIRAAAVSVSSPSSPAYGMYLSQKSIDAMTAPLDADVAVVQRWVQSVDGCISQLQRGVITLTCKIASATELLGGSTSFRRVHNQATGHSW